METTIAARVKVIQIPPALPSLDDLLFEAMAVEREADRIAKARKRLAKESPDLSEKERAKLRAEIAHWELVNSWDALQFVYVEEEDCCVHCQEVSSHFIGLYEFQQNRLDKTLRRFVLTPTQSLEPSQSTSALPRSMYTYQREIPACPRCAFFAGFSLKYEGEVKP